MRVLFPLLLAILLAAICLPHGTTTAGAQMVHKPETGLSVADDEVAVSESANAMREEIRDGVLALRRYETQLEHASSEDSLVLRRQIAKRQIATVETLHKLADYLVGEEKKKPQPALRKEVEQTFSIVTPILQPYVDTLREEIDALRAKRPSTPAKERLALEDEIEGRTRFLDKVYGLYAQHLAKEEMLGLDTKEDRARLIESLQTRADELSGRLDLALARGIELSARNKDDPENSKTPILIIATKKSVATNVASLEATIALMDDLGLSTKDYRTQLVTATRDISSGLFDVNVAGSLISRGAKNLAGWFEKNGPVIAIKLLLFLVILFVFRLLAQLVRRAVDHALSSAKVKVTRLLRNMIVNTVYNLIMLLGLLIALSQFGISLGPLMAGLGVAGFIIGFALQDTLANFASGMMILLYRPYDVGDVVEITGAFGKVEKMSLVSTTILTFDHQTMVVPNNKIWGDVIKNVTDQRIRRVDLTFGISYDDDIEKAEKVLTEILQQHGKILENPAPVVHLHKLNDSSMDFVVRPWVKTQDYWDVYWDITKTVKLRFDEEGISIPFPQQDVHLRMEKGREQKDESSSASMGESDS